MEPTRELYWNVGHGVLIPMYAASLLALGVLVYGFWRRSKVYRQGKPLCRTDNFSSRLFDSLKLTFLQTKVLQSKGPGTAHAVFFWSFLLLFLGTLLVFLQADITAPLFGVVFLKGTFYLGFSLVLDIAGLVAMLTMLGLFARRYFFRPPGLESGADDLLMHLLLFAILASGFLVEGLRMAAAELPANMSLAQYSPVGLLIATSLSGIESDLLKSWHEIAWWGHFFLVMALLLSIPFTKFRHLVTTPINTLFYDRRPKGSIATPDLEDEKAESFGAATIKDLTWKDILDADACTLCKRCQDVCPAHLTEKPLSPMKVITQIGEAAFSQPQSDLADTITRDALWSCTTCRACQRHCPAAVEHVNKIIEIRRNLVLMRGEFPGEEMKTAMEHIEINGNPLGMAPASRGDWIKDLPDAKMEKGDSNILFFAGCYASFDKRNIQVARSFLKVCRAAGIKVHLLGKEEKCCGEPARKMGNEYLYQMLARENIDRIKEMKVEKIVTACPHCFHTLDVDYRDLGLDLSVEHSTTFLYGLLKEDRLKMREEPFSFTYHDSCYVGRYHDIYNEPREILKMAGGTLTEMDRRRCRSFCCGGGGGRILAEEKLGSRINLMRVKMAEATKAHVLASNCPFCLTMFEDGIKTADLDGKLQPKDLAEIIAERLE